MKIYDAMTPNSLRVHAFMAEKGIEIDRAPIDVMGGGTRTPEFLEINSLGELPVLELDDGTRITESVAICRYLEALTPEPALLGTTPEECAWIEMWNRRIEFHIFGPMGNAGRHMIPFFADKVEQVPEFAGTQLRLFDKNWAWLDQELCDGRPFVAGDRFSIADITGMAAMFVCQIMEKDLPPDTIHANQWAEMLRGRPSFSTQLPNAA